MILLVFVLLFDLSFAAECGFECYPKEYEGQEHKVASLMNSILEKMNVSDVDYDENGIQFVLITRHGNETFSFESNNQMIFKGFDRKKKTKVLVHGWMSDLQSGFCKEIAEDTHDFNLIAVDWSCLSKNPNYNVGRTAVPSVGRSLAKFLDKLVKHYKIKMRDLHIIGHSLGAHVSGIAGLNTQLGKVGRITGLDPARPLFNASLSDRLRKESATFVDVIHTDALRLGMFSPVGHADFYPNRGLEQPGCGTDFMGKCSHARSFEYYAESIKNPSTYLGSKCDNWKLFIDKKCTTFDAQMGENLEFGKTGTFYLTTREKYPFGKGTSSLKVEQKESFWESVLG